MAASHLRTLRYRVNHLGFAMGSIVALLGGFAWRIERGGERVREREVGERFIFSSFCALETVASLVY